MAPCQSGDPKERMHPAAVLVGGRWISKGVWHEPVSMEAGMKANMPERWRDKKNADGNRFVWKSTASAPYAMMYQDGGAFQAKKVPESTFILSLIHI